VKALVAAKNTPLAEPEGIESDVGTVKSAELELRTTVPPPDPLRATVQALEERGPMVDGLHVMEEIPELVSGIANESEVDLEEPFSVAVTVTVRSAVKALAVALNTPLVEPDGIVKEDGTVKSVEFELRPIVPPPGPLSVTVQVVDESGARIAGLQAIEVIPVLVSGATSESVVALEEPFSVAVTVTV
jgi:hypothetical protein